MKVSFMLAVGAGLAAATPLRVRQSQPKRPFVQPDLECFLQNCGNTLFGGNMLDKSEAFVGTLNYCQKGFFSQFGESFGCEAECVQSREPAPPAPRKPFRPPDYTFESCGHPLLAGNTLDKSEACVGTLNYCQKGYWANFKEETFGSEDECLRSRYPAPGAPKLAPVSSSKLAPEPTPIDDS